MTDTRAVLTADDVVEMVNRAITRAGTLRQLAKAWGCSAQYLCDVRLGRRAPGPLILDHLGLEQVYVAKPAPTFRRKESTR